MEYISCVIDAINVVESSNASDSVVASRRGSVPIGRAMVPGAPAGPSLRHVAPAAGPISSSTGSDISVKIIEQPAKKSPKFRYEVEGRFAGSIPGASSTKDRKTYPAIEINNYTGKVQIIVSCVTKHKPYRPHPHKLVGRENCFDGLCVMTADITPENRVVTFNNIGIQCVKRNDIAASLALRKKRNIDPFRIKGKKDTASDDHETSTRDIDLHAVRLCFQVFPESLDRYLAIVSDVIYNGPKSPDLKISQISHVSGPASGGTKVILLCEEMKHEDVLVTLHTESVGGAVVWRTPANCVNFHKNVAVVFDTPPYKDPTTQSQITAYIQLQSRSTGERSNSIRFTYEPEPGPVPKRRKPLPKDFLERLESYIPPTPKLYPDAVKTEPFENVSPSPARMDISPMRQNSYEPVPHGAAYHHQKWNQNTPSTSQTGYNQEFPWPAPVQNLSIPHDMHASPMDMPHMTVSPNNPFISPEMLTQAHVTTPRLVMLPQRPIMLPQNNLTSPQHLITLPEGQVNLPQRHAMLPQDHLASPQGQSLPDHMKSPCFTSCHEPHESVNIVQQSVEQTIELTSDPSIIKLLTNGERTFNSGDIAAIAQDLRSSLKDGTDDLSDSFSQILNVSGDL